MKRILSLALLLNMQNYAMNLETKLKELKTELTALLKALQETTAGDTKKLLDEVLQFEKNIKYTPNFLANSSQATIQDILLKITSVTGRIAHNSPELKKIGDLYQSLITELERRKKVGQRRYLLPSDAVLTHEQLCPLALTQGYAEVQPFGSKTTIRITKSNQLCYRILGPNITLYQLSTVDQFALAQKKSIEPAICSVISIYNVINLMNFSRSNSLVDLQAVAPDKMEQAGKFLDQLNVNQWPDINQLKDYIAKASQLGYNIDNINAISTVLEFGSNPFFPSNELLRKKIQDGLKQEYFSFGLIIGNEEQAQETGRGHYFGLTIIKSGDKVEFIITDGAPAAYHLPDDTYEFMRIKYLIEILINGHSSINLIDGTV